MSAQNAIKRIFVNKEIAKEVGVKFIKARIELNQYLPLRVSGEVSFYTLITQIIQFFESIINESISTDELALQKAELILSQFSNGGIFAAKDAATKGIDGSVMAVADAIYTALKNQSEEYYFEKIMREEVDEFDQFEILRFVESFKRYKGLSLSENIRNMRAEELMGKYKDLVRQDIHLSEALTKMLGL